jgi:hypothetical protein
MLVKQWRDKALEKLQSAVDCVAHWTQTRMLLSRVRPRPKEYYLVVYNAALCLVEQAAMNHDPVKTRQAELLLKTTMALEATLDGPGTVQKFQTLLKRLQSHQDKPTVSRSSKT